MGDLGADGPRHNRSRALGWSSGLALALAGCASQGVVPEDPALVEQLEQARIALAAERPDRALAILLEMDEEAVPRAAQARFDYTLALAHTQVGDPEAAVKQLWTFADDHPAAEVRAEVQALLFNIGAAYARSDRYFWLFVDDRSYGRAILEHLVTHFPATPDRDDALHLIGNIAYENGEYEDATLRYQELIRDFGDSEWAELARFRVAMSRYQQLRGPGYDLAAMDLARAELKSLVDNPPDRVEFAREARETLDRVDEWIAAHHLLTADYYRTLENPVGERIYLERACAAPHDATEAAEEARVRLERLPDAAENGG